MYDPSFLDVSEFRRIIQKDLDNRLHLDAGLKSMLEQIRASKYARTRFYRDCKEKMNIPAIQVLGSKGSGRTIGVGRTAS